MLKNVTAFALLGALTGSCVSAEQPKEIKDAPVQEDVVSIPVEPYIPSWKCPDCTPEEQYVLGELQEHTRITDRNALATIMGNIKQESMFTANICEGGARVPYEQCFSGGYGLIQWTTANRYRGLGNFCEKYGCNPSTTEGELRYMFNEYQWTRSEPVFKTPGKTIEWYTQHGAYPWLGWGIHGARTDYAYDYARMLVES